MICQSDLDTCLTVLINRVSDTKGHLFALLGNVEKPHIWAVVDGEDELFISALKSGKWFVAFYVNSALLFRLWKHMATSKLKVWLNGDSKENLQSGK